MDMVGIKKRRKAMGTITRKERMLLKIREARRRKAETRLKELMDEDEQIAEYDGLLTEEEFIASQLIKGTHDG